MSRSAGAFEALQALGIKVAGAPQGPFSDRLRRAIGGAAERGFEKLRLRVRDSPKAVEVIRKLDKLPAGLTQNVVPTTFGAVSGVREYNQRRAQGASIPRAAMSGLGDAASTWAGTRAGPGGMAATAAREYYRHGPLFDIGGADAAMRRNIPGMGVGAELGQGIRNYFQR